MKRILVFLAALLVMAIVSAGCCTVNPASHTDAFHEGLNLNLKTATTLRDHLVPFLEGAPLPLSEKAKEKDGPAAWEKRHLIALLKQHVPHAESLARKGGAKKE